MKTNKELEQMNNEQLVMELQENKCYAKKIQGLLRLRIKNQFNDW